MPKRAKAEKGLPPFDLKASREAQGLSQQKTAAILCASQGSVARWEADGNAPLIYRKYWDLYWSVNRGNKRKTKVSASKKPSASKAKVVARPRPDVDTVKSVVAV